mmetsp:Transcript_22211/g.52580  ORF Transcript_22211/g.52580 Transcript_22211/m.52580 type:complete len:439 (+) Transcript_22211:109-1425(+)
MTKEIINLQIGRCGIQFGHEFWKQICSEHGINPDGSTIQGKKNNFLEKNYTFFNQSLKDKYTPRAILFDLEPRIVSNLLNSTFGNLYDKNNILAEKQGSGNNWANGYHRTLEYQSEIEEALRKESEKCNKLGSFNLFHSTMGGTGSGSGSLILEIIKEEFPGKFLNSFSVVPNQFEISDVVVQPYNSILSMRWLSLYCDCVTFFENDSLQKIIDSKEKKSKISLLQINTLIAKILSAITLPVRVFDCLNIEFEGLFAPLIPIPNLHFLFAGISDYCFPGKKKVPSSLPLIAAKQTLVNKTVNSTFRKGKLLSALKCFDGKNNRENVSTRFKSILLESGIQCIEWAPVSLHFSFINQIKTNEPNSREDVSLFNHTCVKNLFKKTLIHYDMLRKRNAFLNGYLREFPPGEGLELFDDARETVGNLLKEYDNAESKDYPWK